MKNSRKYVATTLFLLTTICVLSVAALAELPPYVYTNMQAEAPEFLQIHVDDVDTGWCFFVCSSRTIKVTATVTAVNRTATQTEVGNTITIRYKHQLNRLEQPGPSAIPILEKDQTYPAYLEGNDDGLYTPKAMGLSFHTL